MYRMLIFGLMLMTAGCSSLRPALVPKPPLVQRLSARGVSDANTRKIVVVGSEGGYGGDLQVTITEDFIIQEIWDAIYQSRPYKTWAASGFRRLRFYTDEEATDFSAELLVNVTDRSHFEGAFDDAFRCPGINKILERSLRLEYERRQSR